MVLDWLGYDNNIIKEYTDHDTIDAQQITAPIMDKYIHDICYLLFQGTCLYIRVGLGETFKLWYKHQASLEAKNVMAAIF